MLIQLVVSSFETMPIATTGVSRDSFWALFAWGNVVLFPEGRRLSDLGLAKALRFLRSSSKPGAEDQDNSDGSRGRSASILTF